MYPFLSDKCEGNNQLKIVKNFCNLDKALFLKPNFVVAICRVNTLPGHNNLLYFSWTFIIICPHCTMGDIRC